MSKMIQWFKNGGFRKPKSPHLARVEAEPGKTTITLTRGGEAVAVVILESVTMNSNDGVTVVFRSAEHFMKERRLGTWR